MVSVWSIVKPLAYASVVVTAVRRLLWKRSSRMRYVVRVAGYTFALFTTGVWAAGVAASMALFGRQHDVNYVVARSFYFLVRTTLGLEVEIEGEDRLWAARPAVYMCNHQSMVDVAILGRLMPKGSSIMAKKELQRSPLGAFMTFSGAVFVDRGGTPAAAMQSMRDAGETLRRRGTVLVMYPEGTRTSREVPDIIPLKKGGFYLAVQAGIPIVPIVAENYWRMYHPGVFEPGRIKVRVLPPVSTEGLTTADVAELAVRVREQMLATLREISVKVPSTSPEASGSSATRQEDDEGGEDNEKDRMLASPLSSVAAVCSELSSIPSACASSVDEEREDEGDGDGDAEGASSSAPLSVSSLDGQEESVSGERRGEEMAGSRRGGASAAATTGSLSAVSSADMLSLPRSSSGWSLHRRVGSNSEYGGGETEEEEGLVIVGRPSSDP